jgi:anti-anti-sigma regulatory factor
VHDEPEKLIMKLEGKMVGAWVSECRRAWTTLSSSVSTGKLALDLRGLTFVDESGLDLLREIYRATRADIMTNSPLTKHFAEQTRGPKTIDTRKGE